MMARQMIAKITGRQVNTSGSRLHIRPRCRKRFWAKVAVNPNLASLDFIVWGESSTSWWLYSLDIRWSYRTCIRRTLEKMPKEISAFALVAIPIPTAVSLRRTFES